MCGRSKFREIRVLPESFGFWTRCIYRPRGTKGAKIICEIRLLGTLAPLVLRKVLQECLEGAWREEEKKIQRGVSVRFICAPFTKFPEIRATRYQGTYHTRGWKTGEMWGGSQSANAYVHLVSAYVRACVLACVRACKRAWRRTIRTAGADKDRNGGNYRSRTMARERRSYSSSEVIWIPRCREENETRR